MFVASTSKLSMASHRYDYHFVGDISMFVAKKLQPMKAAWIHISW